MKIKDVLKWNVTGFNRDTREYIEGKDISEITINSSGIVVFHKNGQYVVPHEGDLSFSKPTKPTG